MMIIVGAVSGACFAALTARSAIDAAINPRFRVYSIVYAAVSAVLAYYAFRAATSGRTDDESFTRAVVGGMGGAVVGFVIIIALYLMFRDAIRTYFARPLGVHLSQVTMFRLVVAFVGLGFGAGFALRTRTGREE